MPRTTWRRVGILASATVPAVCAYALMCTHSAHAEGVTMEKTAYGGWPNCYRVSNGTFELIVTTDVGPRIIRLGFVGKDNMFKEYEDMMGKTGGDEWRIYGGHRLWHSPEARPRTYDPDNSPVEAAWVDDGMVRVVQPTEPGTGIQKEMEITLSGEGARARILHRLRNNGPWPAELAVWCLSVMDAGGTAIVPHPVKATPDRLLPNWTLTLWPYTDMNDERIDWGTKYMRLRQVAGSQPFKIGLSNNEGWGCYLNKGQMFLKKFRYVEGATYPDWGCSMELYTNADMLELETVGPLTTLEPGEEVEHVELWYLFDNVELPVSEEDIERDIVPLVKQAR
ncbi:MAG: hypothetical protein ACE5R4_06570 [Armatimonadota bacterium]